MHPRKHSIVSVLSLVILSFFSLLHASSSEDQSKFEYPEVVRNESVVDDYHGTKVRLYNMSNKIILSFLNDRIRIYLHEITPTDFRPVSLAGGHRI
jgi:hypothetical protein